MFYVKEEAAGWDLGGDPTAALLKMFGDFNFSDDGGDEGFEGMLMKWMKQILRKDIIFEPIQIISSKVTLTVKENMHRLSFLNGWKAIETRHQKINLSCMNNNTKSSKYHSFYSRNKTEIA